MGKKRYRRNKININTVRGGQCPHDSVLSYLSIKHIIM
jgi:hypothetical protein